MYFIAPPPPHHFLSPKEGVVRYYRQRNKPEAVHADTIALAQHA